MIPRTLSAAIISAFMLESHAADAGAGDGKNGALKLAPRIAEPILAPADGKAAQWLKNIRVPAGFTAETWASEPMLGNPVAFTFDEQGRCFTSETNRYRTSTLDIRHYYWMIEDDLAMRSVEDRIALTKKNFPKDWRDLEKETEVIRLIEDTDGDGKADKSRVYADGFNTMLDGIAAGILAHDGKVWFTNIPNLWLLEGTGTDGRAQKRTSLSHGWGVRYSYTGHDFHGLVMGPDGRLYFSIGDRGARIVDKATGKVLIDLPDEGGVFRCEPDGSHLELVMRGLRNPQELAFDDYGNLFTADNDSDGGDRERFVHVVEGGDAGWRVGWQHHPLGKEFNPWLAEKMWEPRQKGTPPGILSPIMNIPDGPSGIAYYPGTGLPAEYAGAFFVCGFKGSTAKSVINTWKVKPSGAGFEVAQEPREFLGATQATDVEFGPDSRIYFSDWGAEGWESQGRGRIYRVTHTAAHAEQKAQVEEVQQLLREGFAKRSSEELVKLLAHADQRIRLRAQWALAEKEDGAKFLFTAMSSGVEGSRRNLSRLHGIWGFAQYATRSLRKMDSNVTEPLRPFRMSEEFDVLFNDPDPEVRAQITRIQGEFPRKLSDQAHALLIQKLGDESPRVRFFAAMVLAKKGDSTATSQIIRLLRDNADRDQDLRHAGVMALSKCADDAALTAAAKDESRSVRLAALLASARRWTWPSIPQSVEAQPKDDARAMLVSAFLRDPDAEIAREAARLINDTPILGAMPALAATVANAATSPLTTVRALNANFRLGKAEHAEAIAKFAAKNADESLRVVPLDMLAKWPVPPARDFVTGTFRPLPKNESRATSAVAALASAAPHLLADKSERVAAAASAALSANKVTAAAPHLLALVQNTKAPAKARLAALDALAKLEAPQLDAALTAAGSDASAALKTAASKLIGASKPDLAAEQLIAAWGSASAMEKQDIATALGATMSAKAGEFLAKLTGSLANEPGETLLEILEAAEAHSRTSPAAQAALAGREKALAELGDKQPMERFRAALTGGDALAGEKLFKEHPVAACLRCHKVGHSGGDAGPALTDFAAKHDRTYILEGIVNVNAKIADGFQMVVLTMKDGSVVAGLLKKETPDQLTIENPGTPAQTVKRADIKQRDNAPSGMLPNLGDLLTKRELRDIVEYVASLK